MQSKVLVKVDFRGISKFILHSRGADQGSHSHVECTHYTCCNHCTLYCWMQTMLKICQLCTDMKQMLFSVALSFAKNSFEWPKRYKILLTEYFLFQKPCKCHLIDPQVSKGHTTGVLRTLPMVEPRPAFSHTVSPVCKPVWYMLHSTIQCTVIATCIMCTLYTRVGAWVSPPGVENELLKCCLYRGVG